MKAEQIEQVFATLAKANPEPKTELYSTNEFTLLVAIVLSAQATDAGVNKATPALFTIADTPKAILALGEETLKTYINTIGLFNSKAKHIMGLSKMLLEDFGGNIPQDRDALQKLPGVGRKTANVWLNCAHGAHTIGVDTHVQRVSNRIGLVKSTNVLDTERQLEKVIPAKWRLHAHHWLILHGRYVCKARKPACETCTIRQWCDYFHTDKSAAA